MDVRSDSASIHPAGDATLGAHASSGRRHGVSWNTSIWRDKKTSGALLAVPARVRRAKGPVTPVTVEFTFDPENDDV